ncbi:MAG: 4Fe-4S dicluster domain-containing protein [Candidatus Lokiarchaeota archaeon]
MNEKIMYKRQIGKFFDEVSKDYNFYAPKEIKGNIEFTKIQNSEEMKLKYFNSKIPPKEILFPKAQTLFKYKINGKEIEIEENTKIAEKNIIFGIRPCDAYSFNLLENFFSTGKFEDQLFIKKRENTIIMGIGCNIPKETCFCTSVGLHPFRKEDMDIFLVDLDEKYLIFSISDKGKGLINTLKWLKEPNEEDLQNALKLSENAELRIKTKIDLEGIDKALEGNFDHSIWTEISENCLGCGTCSFLCPTCHCFDVIDENDHYNNRGRRIRIWDTCQFPLYTLHTSGHNPRSNRIQRCRNRILHKFSYYPTNYGTIGCVGCGRCIQLCPVNNDLRIILEKLKKIEKEEEEIVIA